MSQFVPQASQNAHPQRPSITPRVPAESTTASSALDCAEGRKQEVVGENIVVRSRVHNDDAVRHEPQSRWMGR